MLRQARKIKKKDVDKKLQNEFTLVQANIQNRYPYFCVSI